MAENPIIIYRTEDGLTDIQFRVKDGSVWLTQAEIAELFQTSKQNISHHITSILTEKELDAGATVKEYLTVQKEGGRDVRRNIISYSLEMILAVGYRVGSPRGTQFRQWATAALKEYLIKGFVMNDERLKNPAADYFDELLERIREIRASEKLFYQKVKDIYCKSADYDPTSDQAQVFFKTVQNKMLYAVTGMTAAALVLSRADTAKPNMGLATWEGAKQGRFVRKSDVVTAKNYLKESEIGDLNRIVTMFLDTAEDTAQRRQMMYMKDWERRLDEFLRFNERDILKGPGRVSHDEAERIAHERYAVFDSSRRSAEKDMARKEAATELEELKKLEARIEDRKTKKRKSGKGGAS